MRITEKSSYFQTLVGRGPAEKPSVRLTDLSNRNKPLDDHHLKNTHHYQPPEANRHLAFQTLLRGSVRNK